MRKFAALLISFMIGGICLNANAKQKVVKVSTATEFIRAIKSNTKIVITATEPLDITKALDGLIAAGEVPAIDWDAPDLDYGIYFDQEYDGPELLIAGMIDLTIEGSGQNPVELLVSPRYTDVLHFENCENLTLNNLKLGHTDGGTCSSGVLTLTDCRIANINGCDIYGCGEVGLYIYHCNNVTMNNSIIHDCSERALCIDMGDNQSNTLTFNKCTFTKCNSGMMIGEGTKSVTFNDCKFSDNMGSLFWLQSLITLNNCDVEHHYNDEENNQFISRNGGTWETDFRDAEEYPDIEDDTPDFNAVVRRYAWEGYLNATTHFRLELEQAFNNLVIGEMSYFRKNGTVSDIPVYGVFREIGDGEWLILHEYNGRKECGTITIDIGANDAVYAGTWSNGNKEMVMSKTEKVQFSEGKHETFFHSASPAEMKGEFGFSYVKSEEPLVEGGGYVKLTPYGNDMVRWEMNNISGGIAEANGESIIDFNSFEGSYQNFEFRAFVYKDCIYVMRTNPDDGPIDDWGVAGTLEGVYLRH
ncbi:MAG: right-handed parallel beta-helix repeat-containing protein [Bacteroidaceae bacterium]|nr:right-handed parallel beta-helix repeat-containing protein [Bacteroidaceae bacterium]